MSTSTASTALAQRTVLDRLLESGIAKDRALAHIDNGWVRVDGAVVTDPTQVADPPAHVEIRFVGLFGSAD